MLSTTYWIQKLSIKLQGNQKVNEEYNLGVVIDDTF